MIYATITGRLTKDAALRSAGNDVLCALSIASNKKTKAANTPTFVDATIWGKRGESLVQYLRKGTSVTVVGELSAREHNGKTYLQCRVAEIDFSGGGKRDAQESPKPEPSGGGFPDSDYGDTGGGEDSFPFATACFSSREAWWR